LLAEAGTAQLPCAIFRWLTDPERAYEDTCFGLADVGVLYAVLASFANDSAELNDWLVVERSVSEMRIRLGERARPGQQTARPTR
jgi:hypothetical protein